MFSSHAALNATLTETSAMVLAGGYAAVRQLSNNPG
jgi:hypothetical protein